MGGGRTSATTPEEESSADQDFSQPSSPTLSSSYHPRGELGGKVEDGGVDEKFGLAIEGSDSMSGKKSLSSLDFEANQKKRFNAYQEVLRSYDQFQNRSKNLGEAKTKILSYTPGGWIEKVDGMKLGDYDVPKTTTLLLVGPKGSGKSSLVNTISNVFEEDKSTSARAQVSYNSSAGDGTYFFQEYMIPRGSTSFCLYDTRGLSDDSYDNIQILKQWITKGVHNGKLIIRPSDDLNLKKKLKCKARGHGCQSKTRMVNFVIFVVNGLEVLKSMDSGADGGIQYTQTIVESFNCPYLSFKDDKPVVVITHGDLLSLSNRARVRVHLGELLSIPPTKQIFDIPESCNPVTELTIVDMLRYSLEHADKNLPLKNWVVKTVPRPSLSAFASLFIVVGIAIMSIYIIHISKSHKIPCWFSHKSKNKPHIEWSSMRHLWLE